MLYHIHLLFIARSSDMLSLLINKDTEELCKRANDDICSFIYDITKGHSIEHYF